MKDQELLVQTINNNYRRRNGIVIEVVYNGKFNSNILQVNKSLLKIHFEKINRSIQRIYHII